ncbi:MAG: lysophospholipid acyltransferase family protein [Bdellovibrionota bacterium]
MREPKYFQLTLNPLQYLVSLILGVINFLLLSITILFINALQMVSLIILPFSLKIFTRVNRAFANFWWGGIVFMMERVYRIKFIFTGDTLPAGENVILFANHQGMIDIPVIMPIAWRKSRLGDLKFFVKDILKYVPGPGWGMLFLGCLFVKRDWYSDKDHIGRIFSRFISGNVPIWLVSFLEGTRITAKKQRSSQQFAKERGFKPLKHVMVPRTKGAVGSVIGLREHVSAVYDVTIAYPKGIPTLWQLMKVLPKEFHVNIRRFPVETLPFEQDALTTWFLKRYEAKDELLESFYCNGMFPGTVLEEPYKLILGRG